MKFTAASSTILLTTVTTTCWCQTSLAFAPTGLVRPRGRNPLVLPSPRKASLNKQPLLASPEDDFDNYLQETSLSRAITHLKQNPQLDLTRERWGNVFSAIERRTTEADENSENLRLTGNYPTLSPARTEMTYMYKTLQDLNHLRLYGAVQQDTVPASGSHVVTPNLLEEITGMAMKALTPRPTNTLLIAGIVLALAEAMTALVWGWDLNLMVFATLALAILDKGTTNGAVLESIVKFFSPGMQQKIVRHEAGHFLSAYLLGLPVEGCVLSAWAALQDARFDKRQVTAGTSFFDPELSQQINSSVVTRSSIDRYSIVVMAGIAAEAIHYGQADGGAGDEMALVSFLSQLNGNPRKGTLPPWNDVSIRNQARWGALQAVLMLKEYKVCYDALVDALERGGNLGDCIYAIEKAGRENGLKPLEKPLGYIVDEGSYGVWTTNATVPLLADSPTQAKQELPKVLNKDESLAKLKEYREAMEERLKDIDEKLKQISK